MSNHVLRCWGLWLRGLPPVFALTRAVRYNPISLITLLDLLTWVTYQSFISLVSERILERDPMEEIRRAFKLFDDDGTGKISLRNLRRVAKEIGDRLEDDELYVRLIAHLVYF